MTLLLLVQGLARCGNHSQTRDGTDKEVPNRAREPAARIISTNLTMHASRNDGELKRHWTKKRDNGGTDK